MMTENLNRVSGYRNMMGLTQNELANILNITSQSYGTKERGDRPFSDSEKMKLKKLFLQISSDLTIDDIFF